MEVVRPNEAVVQEANGRWLLGTQLEKDEFSQRQRRDRRRVLKSSRI